MLRTLAILLAKTMPQETWQQADKQHAVVRSAYVARRNKLPFLARFQ